MQSNSSEIILDRQGNEHEVVDYNTDKKGAKLGFWFFLLTELMLFGTMFIVFSFFFFLHSDEFVQSSSGLNLLLGGTNTVILLLSAYLMGLALLALKDGNENKAKLKIWGVIILSIIFLGIKYIEWSHEFSIGIYPNSEILLAKSNGVNIFFGLYFTMTGLHGLHIIIGIILMLWALRLINEKTITKTNTVILDNVTLYWDFVHLVWVFLFPLFYMIGVRI